MAMTVDAPRRAIARETLRARRNQKPTQIRISVVVPTRNEAGNVDELQRQLALALEGIEHEIVVVDDSNDDVTRPVLRAASARDPRWRVIERAPHEQTGLASAVVMGVEAARGMAVCVMDGDLQHPPQVVPSLLAAIEAGADLAVASRYMPGGSRAGLDGTMRNLVSRSCTWLAQAVFPEARRTSDPLSGFFCCRRTAIKGIELKPRGFKILLEVLVCAPRMKVADVPFVFAARLAGESKASTRQGVLFLGHLASLFAYVPGSARPLKFATVTLATFGVFAGLAYGLFDEGAVSWLAWLAATAGGGAAYLGLLQLPPFRDLARHGEPDGARMLYATIGVAAVTSFVVFAALLIPGRHHIFVIASFGQVCGLMLLLTVNQPPVWGRLAGMLRVLPMLDIDTLARRLGAQEGFWISTDDEHADPSLDRLSGIATREMVATASRLRQPALFVERRSPRPQPRLNIESSSAIVVPRLDEAGEVSAIAVFIRRSRSPFESRHLDEAISWVSAGSRWAVEPAASEGVA
jgi:dolichol-phosphate mannosyltransferase